jgi:methanogenic corrinoid protein MtbC1
MRVASLYTGDDMVNVMFDCRGSEALAAPPANRTGSAPGGAWPELGTLARVIEGEIIPRLTLAHRVEQDRPPQVKLPVTSSEVAAFAELIVRADYRAVLAHVDAELAKGLPPESLLVSLFAPTARHLGEMWKTDRYDFVEVTIALSVLQQLIREHSMRMGLEDVAWSDDKRILLVPAPGDQHTFGVAVVEKFFRAAGWEVWGGPAGLAFDLPDLVSREGFSVFGVSLGAEANLDGVVALIRQIRRASRNPAMRVIVGGPVFIDRPELALLIGADATAADAQSAVTMAHDLLSLGLAVR